MKIKYGSKKLILGRFKNLSEKFKYFYIEKNRIMFLECYWYGNIKIWSWYYKINNEDFGIVIV